MSFIRPKLPNVRQRPSVFDQVGLPSLAMTSRINRAIFLIRRNSLTKLVDNVRQSLSAKSCCGITLETADAQFLITLSASLPIGLNDFFVGVILFADGIFLLSDHMRG
jgi:hypothetical protein